MRKWIPFVLVALAAVASAVTWPRLPAQVPVHWNIDGQVDRYGSRLEGVLLVPIIMMVVAVLLPLAPRIDPRARNYDKFQPTYAIAINAVLVLLLAVHALILAASLGIAVPVARLLPVGVGILFITLGNILPRTRSNWFMGIRTPWTLSSDRVWERTHRVGGYLMFGAGVALVIAAAVAPTELLVPVIIATVVIVSVGSVGYSYAAWRQEHQHS